MPEKVYCIILEPEIETKHNILFVIVVSLVVGLFHYLTRWPW